MGVFNETKSMRKIIKQKLEIAITKVEVRVTPLKLENRNMLRTIFSSNVVFHWLPTVLCLF